MKKILFVITGLGAGGAEKVVAQLAQDWAEMGHTIAIACFESPADTAYHDFSQDIDIWRLGSKWNMLRRGRLSKFVNLRALRTLIRRERPDVVFAFLTKNILLSLIAARGSKAKVVCCERNNPERQQAHWLWNWLLDQAYKRADLIICQTQAVTRCIPQGVHDRIRVIPNPIGRWPVTPVRGSPKVIVAAGRLTHQKGFDILLDSFARVASTRSEWQLHIWGAGPDRNKLAAQALASTCADQVQLMGLSERPGGWLRHADVFVFPSRYEGFGNALGEAMAAGLPVIAADCDFGPAEMITDGVDGLLVTPEDPAALAAALATCMDDEALRDRLGRAAAQSIQRFLPAIVLRQWNRALEEAVGSVAPAEAEYTAARIEAAE